jgi:hypothetical protein
MRRREPIIENSTLKVKDCANPQLPHFGETFRTDDRTELCLSYVRLFWR